jgi:hypothetical protein
VQIGFAGFQGHGVGLVATNDNSVVCDLCKRGQLSSFRKELKVRQWSDKGYLHVCVTVAVCICNFCGTTSFGPGADQILDEAFRQEYEKLP